jgi:hypothetical protein
MPKPVASTLALVSFQSVAVLLISTCLFWVAPAFADPVTVRYKEGLIHGFLSVSTQDGDAIGTGDLTQVAHGDRVTSHLDLRLKDGSRQEETTVFSQRGTFRLISYHLTQQGPTFKTPTDLSITAATGEVTVQYTDDGGKGRTVSEHLKLPPDLANGLVPTLLKNLRPEAPQLEVSMVVATPKPRLVKLAISTHANDRFSVVGWGREATDYTVKVDLGGIAGVVAPMIGKQAPDTHIWILGGDAPAFIKSEVLAFAGGPIWRIELAAPTWPRTAQPDEKAMKQ